MLANAPSLRKISDLHFFTGWQSALKHCLRKAIMTSILIVEDDVLTNEYLEFILQQAGYEVVSAASADEAAALLEDHDDVQLIVADYQSAGHHERSKTGGRCEGPTARRNEHHHRDGLRCA